MNISNKKSFNHLLNGEPNHAQVSYLTDFQCSDGAIIESLRLPYCTYGKLNAARSNVIVILHALSTSCLVAGDEYNYGWWDGMVGSGLALDTEEYFIICIGNLGSPFGATSPIQFRGEDGNSEAFPNILFRDIVKSQILVLESLGINSVHAIIGPSMGGMIALEWALERPDFAEKLVLLCSTWRAYVGNIANRAIQRTAILSNVTDPRGGLVVARMHALLSYTSEEKIEKRFSSLEHGDLFSRNLEITNYLRGKSERFAQRYAAECYLVFLDMMDRFDMTSKMKSLPNGDYPQLLVLSASSDRLFDLEQQIEMVKELRKTNWDVQHQTVNTINGHDSFIVDISGFGTPMQKFL
jgi:homoserine O-acetyltransferase